MNQCINTLTHKFGVPVPGVHGPPTGSVKRIQWSVKLNVGKITYFYSPVTENFISFHFEC